MSINFVLDLDLSFGGKLDHLCNILSWSVTGLGLVKLGTTVEPLYNGQVGAGDFIRYLEVSFIGRFHHNHVNLTP